MAVGSSSKREQQRVPIVLNVRIWGVDPRGKPFVQNAQTVDITPTGALLQGVRCEAQPGETVGLQYGGEKARFEVMWVGSPGTPAEGMIGISSLEPEKFLWRNVWPKDHPRTAGATVQQAGQERRLHRRYACQAGAEVKQQGSDVPRWATVRDISHSGAYLETTDPPEVHARLELKTKIEGIEFSSAVVVRAARPSVGMGVAFTSMTPENRDRLGQILRRFAQAESGVQPDVSALPEAPQLKTGEMSALAGATSGHTRAGEAASQAPTATDELAHLEQSLAAETKHADPRFWQHLCAAIVHLREISSAVQLWSRLKSEGRDPFVAVEKVQSEVMRFAAELAKDLAVDLESTELDLSSPETAGLYRETKRLHQTLARALGKEDLPG